MLARFTLLGLYNLLMPVALAAMLPGAWRKMRARGGKPADLWQRLGFFNETQLGCLRDFQENGAPIWVHAASVGEVGIALKLMQAWSQQEPQLRFVLTTTTPTAFAQAAQHAMAQNAQMLPLFSAVDSWGTAKRFMQRIAPQLLVLVEAEVWPNLMHQCQKRGVPVALVNARLSPRSERRFRQFQFFSRTLFSQLQQIHVQEPEDVQRWQSFGLDASKIHEVGSLKFDQDGAAVDAQQVQKFQTILQALQWDAAEPKLLLASSHAGEERLLAQLLLQLRQTFPQLKLMIAPRHVERREDIVRELADLPLQVALRSQYPWATPTQADLLLIDSTGELRAWQSLATHVIVGKSFLAHGGQNPAEALMVGRPVYFGPHMENFEALVQLLLKHQGATQVVNIEALQQHLIADLQQPLAAQQQATQGKQALEVHRGATQRCIALLQKLQKLSTNL